MPPRKSVPPATEAPQSTYTITELAAEFDITPRAIRFYSGRDRTRLKLTLRGKRLGLALQEIKQLVDMYDSQASAAPQLRAFLAILAQHRQQLEQQCHDIEVTLAEIQQHEKRCRALLSQA
jgi:DNA-binding transcriptional MerR regulator